MRKGLKGIIGGFGWVALIRYSSNLLAFGTSLVLAKLLAPEDFGIVAAAAMIIEVLQIFKDLGLNQALVYRQDNVREAANTAFVMIVALNVVVFACAVLMSPFAGWFFNNAIITPVMIVIASNVIWIALRAVPDALLTKELAFQKFAIPELVPAITGSVVGIAMAYQGYGVWSLVVRSVIVSVGGMGLIWIYTPYRPTMEFNWDIAKELFEYGKYIIGSSVFLVALYNIDKLFISRLEGMAALGLYVMATKIANLPISEFSHILCRLVFPVFSRIRQDMDLLRQSFLKTIRYNAFITFPMAIGIAMYGPDVIGAIYGNKWAAMGLPLQILTVAALFRSSSVIILETFKATGNPKLLQQFVIVRLCFIGLLGIPVVLQFGLIGMCYLITITYGAVLVAEFRTIAELMHVSPWECLGAFRLPFLVSLVIIPSVHWLVQNQFGLSTLHQFLAGVALTIVLYTMIVFLSDKVLATDVRKTFSLSS
jgi:O-antigen/teichoic acid export membrane protein